jgi:hypothetical protein
MRKNMAHTTFRKIGLLLSALAGFSILFAATGCGNDESPPDDPAYYNGPMKGKGEQGAGPAGGAVTQPQ